MRSLSVILPLLATVSGCTVAPAPAPVVLDGVSPAVYEQKLAGDVTRHLQTFYPPASTRLSLEQASPSGIAGPLAAELRTAGYAVEEGARSARSADVRSASDATQAAGDQSKAPHPVPLRLVFGMVPLSDMFFVTVDTGQLQMSRVYLRQGNEQYAAGAWTHGERP